MSFMLSSLIQLFVTDQEDIEIFSRCVQTILASSLIRFSYNSTLLMISTQNLSLPIDELLFLK